MPMPAARVTDMHVCPLVTVLVPHVGGPILPPGGIPVLLAGLPAARMGDMLVCVGPPDVIVMGSFTVLIRGQPAARMFDMTAHGGAIMMGYPTVLINWRHAPAAAAPTCRSDPGGEDGVVDVALERPALE